MFGGKISVEVLYQLNTPLCWNAVEIGKNSVLAFVEATGLV